MRFESFLTESSAGGLDKIVSLLVQSLEHKTGIKFWRFGGQNYIERFKRTTGVSGVGLTFVTDSGTMVRFNMEKGEGVSDLSSVDYWTSLQTPEKPTATLKLMDTFNIVQSVAAIAEFLKSKHVIKEEFETVPGTTETSTLTKRIADTDKHLQAIPKRSNVFEELSKMADIVISGVRPSLIVTGDAGVGKTTAITKQVEAKLGPQSKGKWIMVTGNATAAGLYRSLFVNRDKLIVFDDCDDVFKKKDAIPILKAALDSKKEKEVSYVSAITQDVSMMDRRAKENLFADIEDALRSGAAKPPKFPNSFAFTGRIIFISNLTLEQMNPAIVNRSYHVPVNLNSDEMQTRLEEILPFICPGSNMEMKKEVLTFLVANARQKLNARTFVQAMGIRESGNPDWKNLILKYA